MDCFVCSESDYLRQIKLQLLTRTATKWNYRSELCLFPQYILHALCLFTCNSLVQFKKQNIADPTRRLSCHHREMSLIEKRRFVVHILIFIYMIYTIIDYFVFVFISAASRRIRNCMLFFTYETYFLCCCWCMFFKFNLKIIICFIDWWKLLFFPIISIFLPCKVSSAARNMTILFFSLTFRRQENFCGISIKQKG